MAKAKKTISRSALLGRKRVQSRQNNRSQINAKYEPKGTFRSTRLRRKTLTPKEIQKYGKFVIKFDRLDPESDGEHTTEDSPISPMYYSVILSSPDASESEQNSVQSTPRKRIRRKRKFPRKPSVFSTFDISKRYSNVENCAETVDSITSGVRDDTWNSVGSNEYDTILVMASPSVSSCSSKNDTSSPIIIPSSDACEDNDDNNSNSYSFNYP